MTISSILSPSMNEISAIYSVYSDGGSRGNPGPAAYGFIIYDPQGDVVAEGHKYIGLTTNNQAEYQGIVAALERLGELKPTHPVACYLDSQLVVRQINGMYRMKEATLRPWLEKVHELTRQLSVPVQFIDVRREQNKEADRLVNLALDTLGAHHA
jgi:ribonuclease HI